MGDQVAGVSRVVRAKAAQLGPAGQRWLDDLPQAVAALEQLWSVAVTEPLSGGSASYVARVRTGGGMAVLKMMLPGPEFSGQARTLEQARGRGYARLLAADADRSALLMEMLGQPMASLGLAPEIAIRELCRALAEAWRVAVPAGATVAPGTDKASELGQEIAKLWEELARPCSERVLLRALGYARSRTAAFDLRRCVVVHGDPHPGNALAAPAIRPVAGLGTLAGTGAAGTGAGGRFAFIDPDGFLAEPAHDLGVVLRDWCHELLAGDARDLASRYCRLLADQTGVAAAAIWEWGFLERVSTGLYILSLGEPELARPFLDTAELLA
jgi:streptomycin 6-kinase